MSLRICILGGTGFVGTEITSNLIELKHHVTVLTRRRERHRQLLMRPGISLLEGDVYDQAFLCKQLEHIDVVINLVGILNESGHRGRGFQKAHTGLAQILGDAVQMCGVPRLLHMSALNVSRQGPSYYSRSKAEAEEIVHAIPGCAVTSFRPSVIFGEDDSFTNRFAQLLKQVPVFFPLARPDARFQPIFVEDVARCFVESIHSQASEGACYNLCGPTTYTLLEIVEYIRDIIGVDKRIIKLSDSQAWCQAAVMEWLPGKPFSLDNLKSLNVDSVCPENSQLPFGIKPHSMETIVPGYLGPASNNLDRYRASRPD